MLELCYHANTMKSMENNTYPFSITPQQCQRETTLWGQKPSTSAFRKVYS